MLPTCRPRPGRRSDAPEKAEVKIGFIPLTDCASVVMASGLGFDKKYGIKIVPTSEIEGQRARDKLRTANRDTAHVLYGLIYGVQLGRRRPEKDMSVLDGPGTTTARRSRSPTS